MNFEVLWAEQFPFQFTLFDVSVEHIVKQRLYQKINIPYYTSQSYSLQHKCTLYLLFTCFQVFIYYLHVSKSSFQFGHVYVCDIRL